MASILDRYGIKEVADVTFYDLDKSGKPHNPVLFLDTLKVSTIEQNAEEAQATGGKGNAPLIIWDYGKEITVTLEDALFSAKSMAIMFGNGRVKEYKSGANPSSTAYIMKTEQFTTNKKPEGSAKTGWTLTEIKAAKSWKEQFEAPDGQLYTKVNPKYYTAEGVAVATTSGGTETECFDFDATYFCSFDLKVEGSIIDISSNSFPGTYYVTGDTFARSEASGKDEFFQFIIPKAKVQSQNTITLEAEGDPSVFNMNLRVLRPADGVMMKLVKYDLVEPQGTSSETTTLLHNHILNVDNTSDLNP